MPDYSVEECKDASPGRTIRRIKKILSRLPLRLEEKTTRSTENSFGTELRFDSGNVASYGKGISRALSRASAYGEFIERLQNMVLAAPYHLSPDVLAAGGFKFAPDERRVSSEYVLELSRRFRDVYLPAVGADDPAADRTPAGRIGKWLRLGRGAGERNFTALPFCSLLDGKITHLPWQLLTLYRSNGMCAGNTKEEALVQGLSEILERHVNRIFIETAVTPPDIPVGRLKKARRAYSIIRQIEKAGVYRVIAKDCSLGKGFPVLAVILINRAKRAYMVNFGSHPRFEIALERCLTEALQCHRLDARLGDSLLPFSVLGKPLQAPANLINSVRVGRGHFPAAMFQEKADYRYSDWREPGQDNRANLAGLLGFVAGLGADVLVRDKSFLGFPAYQVVVPGLSEVEVPPETFIRTAQAKSEAADLMRDLARLSRPQAVKLASHLISRLPYMMDCRKLSSLLEFPVKSSFPWDFVDVQVFLAMLCYRAGDLTASLAFMPNSENPARGKLRARGRNYPACVRDFLAAVKGGLDKAEIPAVLSRFHAPGDVQRVIREWGEPSRLFSDFRSLPCPDCAACRLREHCCRNNFKKLYAALKKELAVNSPDQRRLYDPGLLDRADAKKTR